MGAFQSKKAEPSRLLQCAMDGDLKEVRHIVETFQKDNVRRKDASGDSDDCDCDCDCEEQRQQLKAFVDGQDAQGNTALHGAVFAGHLDVVRYLVEDCNSDIDLQNGLGCLPLWLAAGYDRCETLEYILRRHPRPASALAATNKTGDSSLLAACSRGNVAACRIIRDKAVELGVWKELVAQRNASDDNGLSVAVGGGHSGELTDLLLDATAGDDLNKPNKKGMVPFLIACERDDVDLAKKLLDNGAEWNVVDSDGSSPLAVAAFCGNWNILSSLLLDKTQLIDKQNKSGCTAVWLAARAGRPAIVEMLLEAGCDATIANKDGVTPLDVARKYDRSEVVALLES